jgi:dimethylhistidine N-methyltransferase
MSLSQIREGASTGEKDGRSSARPDSDTVKAEIIAGLRQSPKRIQSKFFYDERGSKLFEEITRLEEYYLTRVEIEILRQHLGEMSALIGPGAIVIEFGTGAGIKTRMLLEAIETPRAYIPIDISREPLFEASQDLSLRFPSLDIRPVCADYTSTVAIPLVRESTGKKVVFFPGSTIGNFTPDEAIGFLKQVASLVGPDGGLLIGFDRTKDPHVLEAAYNDSNGVTAEFNLNLIRRINSEFSASLPKENFEHFAFFNSEESRIEMHLVSRFHQTLSLDDEAIHFDKGEHIITEYSYKYSSAAFQDILNQSGLIAQARWTDAKGYFEVCYATVAQ